ncbi:WEB family protein At3g02930, chloroplastic-like [Homalodisca vitripennis]|uniref:WEB family protein At3g02930, chloroplastic-like n=1 Tax=Homalodisca vitripennis TaxID=197043 RepID=UPI001EEB965A|nr:WEB family protein At3g02930, chloroplastic-like [Homalodisca vitripennis]
MNPNKSDAKLSLKRKGECAPFVPRKIPIASSHATKIKNDGIHKPKIVDSTGVSASSKYRKLHNCLPAELTPISNKTKILNSKRKSISLVELPSIQKICTLKKRYSKEQGDETKMSIIASKRCNITSLNSVEEFELARKVCKIFILHSWRKRRYEVTKLRIDAQKIENEVQNLNVQIVVLRNLLESEKLRVAVAMSDSGHLKQRLENELNTTDQLRMDLKRLETEKYAQENKQSQMEAEIKSLKNELLSLNCMNKDFKEKIETYDRDLNESREKEARLLSKLETGEIQLKDEISNSKIMTEKYIILQKKIESLVGVNRKLSNEIKSKEKAMEKFAIEIRNLDVELNNVKNLNKVQNEDNISLTKAISIGKDKIKEQEKLICGLTSAINQYQLEKDEFEQRLVKMRDGAVFEAIKICSNLFFPFSI